MTPIIIALVLVSAGMHASWNILAHVQRLQRTLYLRLCVLVCAVGILPMVLMEVTGDPLPIRVWGLLTLAGLSMGCYYFGLMMGYRNGDFSLVYPLARALPVLLLAGIDVMRGRIPSTTGWLGLSLVAAGCAMTPLQSLRQLSVRHFWNVSCLWAMFIAISTVGYSTVDKIAAELLPQGPWSAARYGVWEYSFAIPFLLVLTLTIRSPLPRMAESLRAWKWPALIAILNFGSYWLILWAYQISPFASYVLGLRQFSIVLGVMMAATLLKEPKPVLRIIAAMIICAGILCISISC